MFFRSLDDPADRARAYAAMDAIWTDLVESLPAERRDAERARLAYLIANYAPLAMDEDDLVRNVALHMQRPGRATSA